MTGRPGGTTDRPPTEVILELSPTDAIEQPLPLHQRVLVDATFAKSGDVTYACGMDMVTGVISVKYSRCRGLS